MTVHVFPALAVALGAFFLILCGAGCSAPQPNPVEPPHPPAPAAAGEWPGTAESVCKAAVDWFDKAIASGVVAKMVPAAERAAEKLAAAVPVLL